MVLTALKNLIGALVSINYTELPEKTDTGLRKYIKDDETILLTLLDYRARYAAPRWVDSNTFFNSWFILTCSRIIIARNSSEFKRFRDIPLSGITQILYELDYSKPRISITSPGTEDIIEFPEAASALCAGLEERIEEARSLLSETQVKPDKDEFILCTNCGSKILKHSKFCSECGSRLHSA